MYHRIIKMGLILCVMLCGAAVRAPAQQQQQSMTPEKRALIKELIDATDATKTAEEMMSAMIAQTEKMSEELMPDTISERGSLTRQEQEEHRQKLKATRARMNKRVKELMTQRIDLTKVLAEVSYSIYDKYFTEGEIKDLIAFYSSPTGKKSIELMPKLFADSMTKTAELITPKLQQIMKEIMDEELKKLDEELKQMETTPRPSGQ
jgi:uncharacterized protein